MPSLRSGQRGMDLRALGRPGLDCRRTQARRYPCDLEAARGQEVRPLLRSTLAAAEKDEREERGVVCEGKVLDHDQPARGGDRAPGRAEDPPPVLVVPGVQGLEE